MLGIDQTMFRAYDIRGIAEVNLSYDSVFLIGKAIGSLLIEYGEERLLVARDGRLSGPLLLAALSAGVTSVGVKVIDLGMVPTPLLYYATQGPLATSGVMLTGSHNPAYYNGLKIVVKRKILTQQAIQALYQRIVAKQFAKDKPARQISLDITNDYLAAIVHQIQLARPLHIVIDAGNGVVGPMALALYRQLGCQVEPLYCEIEGTFPHHHPDPSQLDNLTDLITAVHTLQADIGLAFDGDGDRLGIVTSQGAIIYPDRLLMLFATAILPKHPGATVIYDVKCSAHLANLIRSLQGIPLMWKTGHSFIKEKLAETKAILAGEMSGHFFFNDHWYGFDDALYAGARLLALLSEQEQDSHSVFSAIPNSVTTPEIKIAVSEEKKFYLITQLLATAPFPKTAVITLDGIRVNCDQGWGLIRASNTTPHLVLRFEANDNVLLSSIQSKFRRWIHTVQPDLLLPF